jgi:hypothetical protein
VPQLLLGQTSQTLRLWKKIARVAKTPRRRSQEVAENQHVAPAPFTQPSQVELKARDSVPWVRASAGTIVTTRLGNFDTIQSRLDFGGLSSRTDREWRLFHYNLAASWFLC